MSPAMVALIFVGVWLLVGLGLFCAAAGARRLAPVRALAGRPARSSGIGVATGLPRQIAYLGLAVAGLGFVLTGLRLLVGLVVP